MDHAIPSFDTTPFLHDWQKVMNGIIDGAFITVLDAQNRLNTMTLGWATGGYLWRKPVFMAPVRPSRFTHDLLLAADDFTITIPHKGSYKKELAICGTTSGRHEDKLTKAGLTAIPALSVHSPVIDIPGDIFECKILFRTDIDDPMGEIAASCYPKGDRHSLFFGEIVKRYQR